MKIAVTSCADPLHDPEQTVWKTMLDRRPDGLLLNGDCIYLDWGFDGEFSLDWAVERRISDQEFASTLYKRYCEQWQVASFRDLVVSLKYVNTVWDDHDFCGNNTEGEELARNPLSRNWRYIASGLHRQFRNHLRAVVAAQAGAMFASGTSTSPPSQGKRTDVPYPAMPPLEQLIGDHNKEVGMTEMWGEIRILMVDGRFHRESVGGYMLSLAQAIGIESIYAGDRNLGKAPVTLLCTGSTLSANSASWKNYADFDWFIGSRFPRTVVLTGDIHRCRVHRRELTGLPYHEVIASGAARPGGRKGNHIRRAGGWLIAALTGLGASATGNFAILNTDLPKESHSPGSGLMVQLYENSKEFGSEIFLSLPSQEVWPGGHRRAGARARPFG